MSADARIVAHGAIASIALLLFYFVIVSVAESYAHAVGEFLSLAYLMVPLVLGFGIQVSLFSYSRNYVKMMGSSASMTASGGLSTGSMIACCAHHITDLAPVIGVAAAASFLTAYQTPFIVIGLLSNMVGITVILSVMQKHGIYNPQGSFSRIIKIDMTRVRNITLVLSLVIATTVGWVAFSQSSNAETSDNEVVVLQRKVSEVNGLTIEVSPLPFSFDKDVRFQIKMDTHSGDLSFELADVSNLESSSGKVYTPKEWAGSPAGGHHREGVLSFPPLSDKPASIRLILKELYGVDRVFEWSFS